MTGRRPRVLAFGTPDEGPGYPRTPALLADLERIAAPASCTWSAPWTAGGKRALAASPWRWAPAALRWWQSRRVAMARLRAVIAEQVPDWVLVLHPCQLTVPLVRRAWRGPLAIDLFLSAYDTAVVDRALCRDGSLPARLLRRLDRRACAMADLVLVDTPVQAARLPALLQADPAKFRWLPIGFAHDVGRAPYPPRVAGAPLRLLFFGTGVPLHGLGTLLDAVARTPGVELTLIGGTAADRDRARALPAAQLRLLPEFVAADVLQAELQRAELVAGIFGTSAKADAVVPYKVVHALAAGRPVLTAATHAVTTMLQPGHDCLTVPAGDASALAHALQRSSAGEIDLAAIAAAGAETHARLFAPAARADRLAGILGIHRPAPAASPAPLAEAAR